MLAAGHDRLLKVSMRKLFAITVSTLLVSGLAIAGTAPLTLEDVAVIKRVTAARMSPAGDRIAYTLQVPRKLYEDADGPAYHELHVAGLDGSTTPYVTGDIDITDFAWSADGKAIYFLAQRDAEAEFNSLYRIAIAGGEAQELFTHVNSIGRIYPAPDGATLAFTAPDAPPQKSKELEEKGFKALVYEESLLPVRVWMLDLQALTAEVHELPGSASDLVWSADGTKYLVALAPTPLVDDSFTARDIYVVSSATGKVTGRAGSVGKLGAFALAPDGRQIAYVGSEDINDPREGRLFVVPTDGGKRREIVPDYQGHVSQLLWADNKRVRWVGVRGMYTDWTTATVARPQPAGPPPQAGPIIRAIHGYPGQANVAAIAHSPEHPDELYLLRDGAKALRLTNSNPWLADRNLAKQKVIRYPSRDGLELEAVLIEPADAGPDTPLIVYAHGGPESNFSNGWMTWYSGPGQVWAGQGYAVVYPNYRGSTGRGVAFTKLHQGNYADGEFNDLVDAKRYLVRQGLADPDRTGITGGSYGGYASMWSASALSEEYAAAVAFVGISNQISKFGTGDIPYEMYNVHSRAWPWENWMWMLERSPVFHAGKTKTPLLIMAGDRDPRVHPSQSLEMYRNVKLRTETPVRLVFYPGEKHGNEHTAAQYDYSLRLARWMNHYLKGPGGEPPPYELDHAARLKLSDN